MNIRFGIALAAALLLTTANAEARSHSYSSHSYGHTRSRGETDLVTHNRYTNVSGHSVHSPSRTYSGHRPAGASAHCRDGSWSFSEHSRGTCSHHGGVG